MLTIKATTVADPGPNPAVATIDNLTNVLFKKTDTKLDVPVVTLSTENDKKLFEQLRTELNEINIDQKWQIK